MTRDAPPPPLPPASQSLHATAIAIDGRAVLLTGPTRSGKSDLALRLIDRGAALISDDLVCLSRNGARIIAAAPAGAIVRLHVRSIGMVAVPIAPPSPLALVVMLGGAPGAPDEAAAVSQSAPLCGLILPQIPLNPWEISAPITLGLALDRWGH